MFNMPGPTPADLHEEGIALHGALAAKALRLAGGEVHTAIQLLDRAVSVHPRRAELADAIAYAAHRHAIRAAGIPAS
ncbi:TPA: hypothetical protein VMX41_001793 [Streptococcus pyogenes]|nr:hypothetical protein [Streptococcus pyogenes]